MIVFRTVYWESIGEGFDFADFQECRCRAEAEVREAGVSSVTQPGRFE
jgi:hypothetical protein